MDDKQIIEKVAKQLKSKIYYKVISDYLLSENIPENEHDAIFKKARELLFEEKIPAISNKNKITFAIYFGLAIITFFIFFFILPEKIESKSIALPFLGAVTISFLGIIAYTYYNSWKFDLIKIQQCPNINYSLIGMLLIFPSFILGFIISYRFDYVTDELLKKNQIEVDGKIISGNETNLKSLRRDITISTVNVEFKTLEGREMIVNLDISENEFKEYYINQEVKLIYSKTNPSNASLLTNASNITKFKNTKEEDITIKDLISLINIEFKKREKELNKFSYGWEFNSEQNLWINNRRNVAVGFKENSIIYVSENPMIIKHYLKEQGFKNSKKDSNDIVSQVNLEGTYKKEGYTATIEPLRGENGEAPVAITTITKNN